MGFDFLYDRYLHETAEHTSLMTNLKQSARMGYFNLLPTQNSVFTFYLFQEVSSTDPFSLHFSNAFAQPMLPVNLH